MGNTNAKLPAHINARSNLQYYLMNESNLGLFTSKIINTVFVNNLHKMNVLGVLQSNSINALMVENSNSKNKDNDVNYIKMKNDITKYISMINDTIDDNLQGCVNINRNEDNDYVYEEILNAYENNYNDIIIPQEKPMKSKEISSNIINSSLNSCNNDTIKINIYKRPESSREVYNYSHLSATTNVTKLNESLNEMNTISTSSNTITNPNKMMKVMKIGRKEEFTLSGSKEKNNSSNQGHHKRHQMSQKTSPSHKQDSIYQEEINTNVKPNITTTNALFSNNNLNTISIKTPITHRNNQSSIEVKQDSIMRHQQNYTSVIHQQNKSIIQINKSCINRNEKSLSPRQKYSLLIPLPKQKKTSISPPNSHHNSITTMISSPFDPIPPIKPHNSNASSISASTSSYVKIMKQSQKYRQDKVSIDFSREHSMTNNIKGNNIKVIGNASKSNSKRKSRQRKHEEGYNKHDDKRPISKPKMTFDLDLSDDDNNDNNNPMYQCTNPSNQPIILNSTFQKNISKTNEEKSITQLQTQEQKLTQRQRDRSNQLSPNKSIDNNNNESCSPNCNIMLYKTSDKLQKLKELKSKQIEAKQPTSFSMNTSLNYDTTMNLARNDNQYSQSLESIKEENRSRSKSLSQDHYSSSSDKFSFRKDKSSSSIIEKNKDKEMNNNNNDDDKNEIESYLTCNNISKLPILQFKVNSDINMNDFNDIIFLN